MRATHAPPCARTRPPPHTRPLDMHPPSGYYEIRSMSGRYASYWNAFLFLFFSNTPLFDIKRNLISEFLSRSEL